MYDDLVKRLRAAAIMSEALSIFLPHSEGSATAKLYNEATEAIEELSGKVESLQFYADNISKLPDCNTCLKKNTCEFVPRYGEYCRINCPAWLGQPPKEE